ncbi:DUF6978 family protein [Lactobacillus hominis]|uniref:Uncharacterized protein n=1 Tax=Lactobacillus hominis DSM 23910 = CRBIP 24.179 TaxID=1423758 RepID=I7L7F2_9LACO|nr:hypothetical protein [Lactobacillus hominis]KRM84339.1 hypothetical protein FC41_GL001134 [Lactobacillus hominis DSM 23910 = CRBIP 24.179]MCT3347742.1 hypothetical protein [Lactobacillus hominis]CCI82602.1 G7ZPK3 (Putative uncharacterized protein) [Lactobacillus hominis DSM 23910 = CRBIP 24.179]
MEIALNQQEANHLISLIKTFLKKYVLELEDGSNGCLDLRAKENNRQFKLFYHFEKENCHLNFLDCDTKLNLVRFNLNNSFHKNANGDIIRGNRVNLFCEDEFKQRNDGQYMRAYKLPYKDVIADPPTFLDALEEMLAYTHVKIKEGSLEVRPKLL